MDPRLSRSRVYLPYDMTPSEVMPVNPLPDAKELHIMLYIGLGAGIEMYRQRLNFTAGQAIDAVNFVCIDAKRNKTAGLVM